MSAGNKRVVFGIAVLVTRTIGWILVAIAVLSLPQIRSLLGNLANGLGWLTSLALGLAGVLWLVGVELFLHFFDSYLSRNQTNVSRRRGTPSRTSLPPLQVIGLTTKRDEHHCPPASASASLICKEVSL